MRFFQVYTQSTNYDRTLQSATANMAGWFPPNKNEVWDNTALAKAWRPFPVRVSSDPSLLGETDCERIDLRPYPPHLQKIFDAIESEHKVRSLIIRQGSGRIWWDHRHRKINTKYPNDLWKFVPSTLLTTDRYQPRTRETKRWEISMKIYGQNFCTRLTVILCPHDPRLIGGNRFHTQNSRKLWSRGL